MKRATPRLFDPRAATMAPPRRTARCRARSTPEVPANCVPHPVRCAETPMLAVLEKAVSAIPTIRRRRRQCMADRRRICARSAGSAFAAWCLSTAPLWQGSQCRCRVGHWVGQGGFTGSNLIRAMSRAEPAPSAPPSASRRALRRPTSPASPRTGAWPDVQSAAIRTSASKRSTPTRSAGDSAAVYPRPQHHRRLFQGNVQRRDRHAGTRLQVLNDCSATLDASNISRAVGRPRDPACQIN